MIEKKTSKTVMDQATDTSSEALKGVQNVEEVVAQFNEKLDEAGELASLRYQKEQ